METKKHDWAKYRGAFIVLGILFLLLFAFMRMVQSNTPASNATAVVETPEAETSSKVIAYHQSQAFVKRDISFPEEADFPFSYIEAYEYQDNIYKINSEVTGKNAYGVKIKKRYGCQLQYLGGDEMSSSNWKLMELKFF